MNSRHVALQTPAALGWSEARLSAKALSPGSSPARLIGGSTMAADFLVVLATSLVADVVRNGPHAISLEVVFATLLGAVLLTNVLQQACCYGRLLTAPLAVQTVRVVQGWSTVLAALPILSYMTKTSGELSRFWAVAWWTASTAGLALVRVWAAKRLRHWRHRGKLARTVAVVDLDGRGHDLARQLLRGGKGEMLLAGVFSLKPNEPRRSGTDDLVGLARLFRIDEVVIAASTSPPCEINAVMRKLGTLPTNVWMSPFAATLATAVWDASFLFGLPMVTMRRHPLGDWSRVAKRAGDLVLTTAVIGFIAPVLTVIALAVRLDSPGPILFRQRRLGFNNNVINIFKFRTMVHQPKEDTRVVQAQRRAKRVTRVGRFLRRTSLDELLQLLNVLRGEMSLVGPRPHALAHNDEYAALIDGYLGRHRVQPGITGWAQVNGLRGETDILEKMQRRVEHDLAYIDQWWLRLDLKILALTVVTTLFDRNVY